MPTRVPECLAPYAGERRWVGWRWQVRNGKSTKPPVVVIGGRVGGPARSDDPATWASLADAYQAEARGTIDGIGLQLLGLEGFAALDLDDVRDPVTGDLLDWVRRVVAECASYAEVTPSGRGIRILGRVPASFPPTHQGARNHPEGGRYEIYANVRTGRYITVTGERLPAAPDTLADLSVVIDSLTSRAGVSGVQPARRADGSLPPELLDLIARGRTADRSADFQSAVLQLHRLGYTKEGALELFQAHPEGPAGKYHGRLESELDRSWRKAEAGIHLQNSSPRRQTDNDVLSQDEVARQLVDRHASDLRFLHGENVWLLWDGEIWRRDRTGQVLDLCRHIVRELTEVMSPQARQKARTAAFINGAERLARMDRRIAITADELDRAPLLLGIPGGTIDLATGLYAEPRREDFITRRTAVAPDFATPPGTWLSFIEEATGGDPQFAYHLKRVAGRLLIGEAHGNRLIFLYDPRGDAGSLFKGTMLEILGDYAAVAPAGTLLRPERGRHPTDLAMLAGARLVVSDDAPPADRWSPMRVRQLIVGEPISARFVRGDFFTFTPTFMVLTGGNEEPVHHGFDSVLRRHIHIVPLRTGPIASDPEIRHALRREQASILGWMIRGAMEERDNCLPEPPPRSPAGRSSPEPTDPFSRWLREACLVEPDNPHRLESFDRLFSSWKDFATAAGLPPETPRWFAGELDRRGFPSAGRRRIAGRQVRVRRGIALA